jgi:hypothetical protein
LSRTEKCYDLLVWDRGGGESPQMGGRGLAADEHRCTLMERRGLAADGQRWGERNKKKKDLLKQATVSIFNHYP